MLHLIVIGVLTILEGVVLGVVFSVRSTYACIKTHTSDDGCTTARATKGEEEILLRQK